MNPSARSRSMALALAASLVASLALATAPAAPVATASPAPLFTPETYPRVDGSTVTQPLGVAFQKAFTGADVASDQVVFSTTDPAYHNLVDGKADVILVTSPSDDELAYAASHGVELEVVPVVAEAFVFLVNSANPVTSLTLDQVRSIYSGTTQYWDEVGSDWTDEITPYQRPVNSGSQTGMLDLVMRGQPMTNAPLINRPVTMSDLVYAVGFDRTGIGYSYYYYVTQMYGDLASGAANPSLKLLAINGVAPTPETIRSGQYPVRTNYYMVFNKAAAADSPTRRLVDAMLSDQGQQTAQAAGYVPLRDVGVTPPLPDDPFGLTSLDETYTVNPLAQTVTPHIVTFLGCAQLDRLTINGLKDGAVQDRINATFEQRQDAGLGSMGSSLPVPPVSSTGAPCSPDQVQFGWDRPHIDATVSASFSNILSLSSRVHKLGFDDIVAAVNVRLDTGADLKLADVFTQGTDIEGLLLKAWATADPAGDEEAFLEAFRADPNPAFFITPTGVTVYVRSAGYTIPFASNYRQVAIFKRFATPQDLYTAPVQVSPCKVTTYESAPWPVDGVSRVCLPRPADEPSVALAVPDKDATLSRPSYAVITAPEAGGVYSVSVTSATPWATSWDSTPATCPNITWAIDGQPAQPLLIGQPGTTKVTITVDRNTAATDRVCQVLFASQANSNVWLEIGQAASSQAARLAALLQPLLEMLRAWLAQMAAIFGLPR